MAAQADAPSQARLPSGEGLGLRFVDPSNIWRNLGILQGCLLWKSISSGRFAIQSLCVPRILNNSHAYTN